jgi:hypothetical protein
MYESRTETPIHGRRFLGRLLVHLGVAAGLLTVSLAGGMAGYMALEDLSAMDAFLNSAMLLGGMGPVNTPKTGMGKLSAGAYALDAGLVFIVTAALIFTSVIHRVLHQFHWDEED